MIYLFLNDSFDKNEEKNYSLVGIILFFGLIVNISSANLTIIDCKRWKLSYGKVT